MFTQTRSLLLSLSLSVVLVSFGSLMAQPKPAQQEIPAKALAEAVEKGDRAKVLALLSQGADINLRWINDTPLEAAIFQQDLAMVTLLLDKGAKIKDGDLADAAHGAQGNLEKAFAIVKLLIARGANVSGDGPQALREAATANNLDVLRYLLTKGADINGKDKDGDPILMSVVGNDSLEGIQILLEAGADASAKSKDQDTVLMRAAQTNFRSDPATRVRVIKLLLEHGADIRARNQSGSTALHYGVQHVMSEAGGMQARPEVVQALLDNGAEVNAKDNSGMTALMQIVRSYHSPIEIAQLLVTKGADVNLANEDATTALMLAAEAGRADLAQMLIDKGALINVKDKAGRTPIVYATEAGQPQLVSLLANRGADLSLTSYHTEEELKQAMHRFMLLRAVSYHNVDDMQMLLKQHVDANSRDEQGHPAIVIASSNARDPAIVRMLLDNGANIDAADSDGVTALMSAAAANDRDVVALLLERRATVDLKNKKGQSALMRAADEGHTQIATLLLAKGADVRMRDIEGNTALLLASRDHYAQEDLVRLLIAKGASATDVDSQGNTPLMLAAKVGAFEVIEPLISGGVNVNAKNKSGWTALRLTRESKDIDEDRRTLVIKILTKAGAKE